MRSPHAHARILDIAVDAALELPGVHAIYTYDDLEADSPEMAENLPLLIPHPAITAPRNGYPLAKDEVNHVGEAIVMVVADNRYIAEDACALIDITYETLPAVVGVDTARNAEHVVHPDVPDNVAAHLQHGFGDIEAELAAAPHTLTLDLEIERSASMPMEGKGVYARWDDDEKALTFWTSTQTSTSARAAIAARLGMAHNKVHCIAPDVGGGFGVKIVHPWPEEVMVTWAARKLGQAGISNEVKWVEDRREHFVSSAHERGQIHEVTIGFDDDGRLLAFDFSIWHDNGAYLRTESSCCSTPPRRCSAPTSRAPSGWTPTRCTPTRSSSRPTAVRDDPRACSRWNGRWTPSPSISQGCPRGPRDQLHPPRGDALRLPPDLPGRSPAHLRQRRLPGRDGQAQETHRLGRVRGVQGTRPRRGPSRRHRCGSVRRGHGTGPVRGRTRAHRDLGQGQGRHRPDDSGQGHQTSFAQIVADDLGVPVSDVEIVTGDTRRFGYAVGTFASRGAVMSGSAFHVAAQMVAEKAKKIAADHLHADVADLELREGHVCVVGTEPGAEGTSIPLGVVAVLSNPLRYAFDDASRRATGFANAETDMSVPPVLEGEQPGLEATGYYSPPTSTFASGIHAAIVETDPVTAEIRVLRYAVVHDCGNVINPRIVEGQVQGAVAQGIGGALYEKIVYDEHGQMLNASYMDFLMPFVTEMPDSLEMDHTVTPSTLNPLGMKGAGEAGVIPTSAVIAAAVEDAEGIPITSMPISPSELFELRLTHAASRNKENE